MNKCLFISVFFKVARTLLFTAQSRNNKNWPNKNNDVITDLGGGGNFPMFLFVVRSHPAIAIAGRALLDAARPAPCPSCTSAGSRVRP